MVLINKMFCFNIDNIILVENGLNLITVELNEHNCFLMYYKYLKKVVLTNKKKKTFTTKNYYALEIQFKTIF